MLGADDSPGVVAKRWVRNDAEHHRISQSRREVSGEL